MAEPMSLAPQFSWEPGWQLDRDGDQLLITGATHSLTQAQIVSAGSAAELLVLGCEAEGRSATVEVLPDARPNCLLALHCKGSGPSARARTLLSPAAVEPRALTPSDVRHLNLAAEAYGCELLWQDVRVLTPGLQRVYATSDRRPLTTVVTRGDTPHDWVQAGRAAARCSLAARQLGLVLDFGVHAFTDVETREEVRRLWQLDGWPQVQFTLAAA